MGRWTEAQTFIDKCMTLDFEWNMGRIYCDGAKALMAAHQKRPDWPAAEAHVESALQLAESLHLRPDLAVGRLVHARLLAEKGDLDAARDQLDQADALFRDMGMEWWRSSNLFHRV